MDAREDVLVIADCTFPGVEWGVTASVCRAAFSVAAERHASEEIGERQMKAATTPKTLPILPVNTGLF
jgi:hypothetical protein